MEGRRLLKNTAQGEIGNFVDIAIKITNVVGTVYLIYRGVRMLASLLPPLWWTIPANVAIP